MTQTSKQLLRILVPCCRWWLKESQFFHLVGEKYVQAVLEGIGGLPLLLPALDAEGAVVRPTPRVRRRKPAPGWVRRAKVTAAPSEPGCALDDKDRGADGIASASASARSAAAAERLCSATEKGTVRTSQSLGPASRKPRPRRPARWRG